MEPKNKRTLVPDTGGITQSQYLIYWSRRREDGEATQITGENLVPEIVVGHTRLNRSVDQCAASVSYVTHSVLDVVLLTRAWLTHLIRRVRWMCVFELCI